MMRTVGITWRRTETRWRPKKPPTPVIRVVSKSIGGQECLFVVLEFLLCPLVIVDSADVQPIGCRFVTQHFLSRPYDPQQQVRHSQRFAITNQLFTTLVQHVHARAHPESVGGFFAV